MMDFKDFGEIFMHFLNTKTKWKYFKQSSHEAYHWKI